MSIVIVIIIAVAMLIGLIFLLSLIPKDSPLAPLGINIKRVHCPNCNAKQPIARKPANQRQMLFGGYTCKQCNTEMDKFGTVTPPQKQE